MNTCPIIAASLLAAHNALPAIRFVDVNSTNPMAPFTTWGTAARVIQDAVDAAEAADDILVTNGVYETGGRAIMGTVTNRVAVDKPVTLRSVNGPEVTIIRGYRSGFFGSGEGAVRCVYLTNDAALIGFTLTAGGAWDAGGVRCASTTAIVSNCVLTGNSAFYSGGGAFGGTLQNCLLTGNRASSGGGSYQTTLNNCVLTGNTAIYSGGGAYLGTLNNCTVASNSAADGGGTAGLPPRPPHHGIPGGPAIYSILNNCILYHNTSTAEHGDANYSYSSLHYTCTIPLPTNGVGNITNAPLFVDQAGGNLRLQSNSPCINAGRNTHAPAGSDLDGQTRIAGGTVDIGAYEFQSPQSAISYGWLQQYGLSTDGSVDFTDSDSDGLNTWQEWRAQTDPTNALSVLRMFLPVLTGTNVTVRWQSVAGVNYFLERSTTMAGPPPIFTRLAMNLPGQPGETTYTDTNAPGAPRHFYRIGVE